MLHLLAPNQRAVQVTTDLAGFWERHYPSLARSSAANTRGIRGRRIRPPRRRRQSWDVGAERGTSGRARSPQVLRACSLTPSGGLVVMTGLNARSTGITIALTLALAVGLSFAPVPDAFKPFPSLTREPIGQAVAALLMPERGGARAQEVMTGEPVVAEATPTGEALPEEAEEALQAAKDAESEPAGTDAPPSPATSLGAAGFRSVRHLERIAQDVGAAHVDIESPASLERFFTKLESLQRGEREEPVRVVHLGDSRDRVGPHHRSGAAAAAAPIRLGRTRVPLRGSPDEVRRSEGPHRRGVAGLADHAAHRSHPRGIFGFSGARFLAPKTRETTEFDLGDARSAELFFATDPDGGLLEVLADGKPVSRILTQMGDRTWPSPASGFPRARRS